MHKIAVFFVFSLTISLFSGCSCYTPPSSEAAATQTSEVTRGVAGNVVEITSKAQFENYKKSEKNIVLKFYGSWCPPCQRMKPIDAQMAQEFAANVTILAVDFQKASDVASLFNFQAVPTYIYLKDGNEVARSGGAMSVDTYRNNIKKHFGL